MVFLADEHGYLDLLVDGPNGLEDRRDELLGRVYTDGMGAFVTWDNHVAISGDGSSVILTWTGTRFVIEPNPMNPTTRWGQAWDCHEMDLDDNEVEDQFCGGDGRADNDFSRPESVAMFQQIIASTRSADARGLMSKILGLARETRPHEISSLGFDGGRRFLDIRYLLTDGWSSNRLLVHDLDGGRIGVVRMLNQENSGSGGSPGVAALSQYVPPAGMTVGHGLNVRVRGYPEMGLEAHLRCVPGGTVQHRRFWNAGRLGSQPEFFHFGCPGTTFQELWLTSQDGVRELAHCGNGAMDSVIIADTQSHACRVRQ